MEFHRRWRFCFASWESVRLRLPSTPRKDGPSGDQLIDILVASFRLFAKGFALFAGAAQWMLTILAAVSFVCALLALLLFMTGRGINTGRSWARVVGVIIAAVSFTGCLAVSTALDRSIVSALVLIMAGMSAYVVWTLGWRFP